ncbi:MAG: hypothetical protein Q8928_01870 [Bacteroidota bacterium]|nr:hypothetical protein [Bacteroidota bacterium]
METPEKLTNDKENGEENKISRKQALRKAGYIALSATTMMLLLSNPAKAQAVTSSAPQNPPEW